MVTKEAGKDLMGLEIPGGGGGIGRWVLLLDPLLMAETGVSASSVLALLGDAPQTRSSLESMSV